MGNHYVPKYYLSGFTDPSKPHLITRYEKGTKNVIQASLDRVAQETGFYSDDLEAFLSEKVEDPANEVIKRIRNGEVINSNDKAKLAEYMKILFVRVPKAKARAEKWFEANKEQHFASAKSDILEFLEKHPEKEEMLRIKLSQLDRIQTEGLISAKDVWQARIPTDEISLMTEAIFNMTWQFCVAPSTEYFLTSDNPFFFFESIGVGKPYSEFSFPVSSTTAIWGTWRKDLRQTFIECRKQGVHEINRRTISAATKYVFNSVYSSKIVELVNKQLRLGYLR